MFFSVLGVFASSIENIAIEISHLQRTEIGEISEYFSTGQKGSSAMPHKCNPILSESLTELSSLISSYVFPPEDM
jgi:adenylosuccinate lyase